MTEDEFRAWFRNKCISANIDAVVLDMAADGCVWYITNLIGDTWDEAHNKIASFDLCGFAQFFYTMTCSYTVANDKNNKRAVFMQSLVDQRPPGTPLPEAWRVSMQITDECTRQGINIEELSPIVAHTEEAFAALIERNNKSVH